MTKCRVKRGTTAANVIATHRDGHQGDIVSDRCRKLGRCNLTYGLSHVDSYRVRCSVSEIDIVDTYRDTTSEGLVSNADGEDTLRNGDGHIRGLTAIASGEEIRVVLAVTACSALQSGIACVVSEVGDCGSIQDNAWVLTLILPDVVRLIMIVPPATLPSLTRQRHCISFHVSATITPSRPRSANVRLSLESIINS